MILRGRHPEAIAVSAKSGEGLDRLKERVAEVLTRDLVDIRVQIPLTEGRLLADLATWSVPISKAYTNGHVRLALRVPARALYRIERFRVEE